MSSDLETLFEEVRMEVYGDYSDDVERAYEEAYATYACEATEVQSYNATY